MQSIIPKKNVPAAKVAPEEEKTDVVSNEIDPIDKGFEITTTYSKCDPDLVNVVATSVTGAQAPTSSGLKNTQIKIIYRKDKATIDILDILDITFPSHGNTELSPITAEIKKIVTENLANVVMNMYHILLDLPVENITDFFKTIQNDIFNPYLKINEKYPIKFTNDISKLKAFTFAFKDLLTNITNITKIGDDETKKTNMKKIALKLLTYFVTFFSTNPPLAYSPCIQPFSTYLNTKLINIDIQNITTENIDYEKACEIIQYSIVFLYEYILFIHIAIDAIIKGPIMNVANGNPAGVATNSCIINKDNNVLSEMSLLDLNEITHNEITHNELDSSQVNMIKLINKIKELLLPTASIGGSSNMKMITNALLSPQKKTRKTEKAKGKRFKGGLRAELRTKRRNTAKR